MNKHKQHIYAFPLLLLVLLPMAFCVYFLQQQHSIKEKMEQELEKSSLTTLTIFKSDVQWVELGKELIVDGEMFDVKSVTQKNDSLVIKGIFDTAEKALKQELASVLDKQKNTNTPLQQLIAQFLSPIILTQNTIELKTYVSISPQNKYFISTQNISSIYLENPTPPPNSI
jgi:Ca2+/Na+ antiporter